MSTPKTIQKVLVSDPLDQVAIDILKTGNVTVDVKTGLKEDALVDIIGEYDALIVRSGTQVTSRVIRAGHKLQAIGRAGVGVDNIDVPVATEQKIVVVNSPGGNTIAACELTCTLLLSMCRHITPATTSLKAGKWDRKLYTGCEVYGKTLAVIGLGRIGREVASRMRSFGMKTIGYDPIISAADAAKFDVDFYELDQLWSKADFITFHVPLLPSTKYLLNKDTMSRCKKGVRVINVARGGIIEEAALLDALVSGQVAGAALDVYESEPPTCHELLKHPGVVCVPHLGASTQEAQTRVAQEVADQFLMLNRGEKVFGAVNPDVLN